MNREASAVKSKEKAASGRYPYIYQKNIMRKASFEKTMINWKRGDEEMIEQCTFIKDAVSYHCGVMDAFAEVVGAGVKKLALSHPFSSVEEMQFYLPFAQMLCERYDIKVYAEKQLLLTDLFPKYMNEGKCNLLFYKEEETLQRYLWLKEEKQSLKEKGEYKGAPREWIAMEFGKLLSYEEESCRRNIRENDDKEEEAV